MPRKTALLLLALALAVAACGGGGESASPTEPGEEPSAEPTSAGEEEPQTLAAFFGWDNGDPAATEARLRDQEARVQESIRRCMAEQGFEYQPVLPPDDAFRVDATSEDHEEWVRKHGFGITTWFGNEEEFTDRAAVEWEDPNQEMLDAMSESERQAWYDALYGTEEEQMATSEVEIDEETGETIYVQIGHGAGCEGQAYEEVFGDPTRTQELYEQLGPAFEELSQRIEADPRIVELNEDWAACMQEAGYEVTTRNQMWETVYTDFQERLDAIVGGDFWVDPFEGWSEEEIDAYFEEHTQEEIEALYEEAQQAAYENIDMEAVRALQQEEIDIALKDLECARDWDETYAEVSADYEAEFIQQNREILEQIRELEGS